MCKRSKSSCACMRSILCKREVTMLVVGSILCKQRDVYCCHFASRMLEHIVLRFDIYNHVCLRLMSMACSSPSVSFLSFSSFDLCPFCSLSSSFVGDILRYALLLHPFLMLVRPRARTHTHVHARTCTHTRTSRTHAHTHTHTHTHSHTHTHTHKRRPCQLE